MDRKLILANGRVFKGYGFGAKIEAIHEIVFNTSMVGYQEVLSDPSYNSQMVCMTYPLIGNYGLTDEDYETRKPSLGGMIVKDYNDLPSNFRFTKTLSEVMEEYKIPGIYGIDTRELTRVIRNEGSQAAMICDIKKDDNEALAELRAYVAPTNQVSVVSYPKVWYSRTHSKKFDVVAIDCGIKLNIVRKLNQLGCNVVVVPYNTTVEEIMSHNPDGLFISNGPGNPESLTTIPVVINELQGKLPIFGICLGHQIIALANGAKTYKMKFGHRGANHPVKNLENGKIEITSQNHSYAVDSESLKNTRLTATHINILDNTIEGIEIKEDRIFSVQYHPESAPGPEDSEYLFHKFIDLMKGVN